MKLFRRKDRDVDRTTDAEREKEQVRLEQREIARRLALLRAQAQVVGRSERDR